MAENKLKPCPFCGGEANVDVGNFGGMVCYCKICFSQGKQCETKEEAIEAWNRRSSAKVKEQKNKMKQVAALFGKKLGERFGLGYADSELGELNLWEEQYFYFGEDGLMWGYKKDPCNKGLEDNDGDTLQELLTGNVVIVEE